MMIKTIIQPTKRIALFHNQKSTTMQKYLDAILAILSRQNSTLKRSTLIHIVKKETGLNFTNTHISVLIQENKIERVGKGKYQIVNNKK